MLAEIISKIAEFDRGEPSKFYPRPSLAGPERCKRQMVYLGLGTPRKALSGRFMMVMDDSSWHEDLTLDWLKKSSFKVHSTQMRVECPPPMQSGSIDGIITDMNDKDYLLEHKAVSHFSFENMWDKRMPVDYFTQCAIYLWGLQLLNPEIDEAILLIKNKNTAQYFEFRLHYDKPKDLLRVLEKTNSLSEKEYPEIEYPDIVKTACNKFNAILKHIAEQSLPKRDYESSDWQCRYCGWCKICWEEYEKEFQQLATGVELAQDLCDLVGYYQETKMHLSEMEKEADEKKAQIKNLLKERNIREGKVVDRYLVFLKLQKRETIDKEMLTPEEITRATKITESEVLYIKNYPKPRKEK